MSSQFMVDIEGTELSALERSILKQANVGAVILFTRNFTNPEQLAQLIRDINEANPELFIAIDHEGGNVQRFQRQGFSAIPAARTYGRVYDNNREVGIAYTQEYGEIMANELLAVGVDLSIAPVLDVHDQSRIIAGLDRAFHTDPDAIIDLTGAFIKGMNSAGMPAVGKHFPGHGSVVSDSHIAMPISQASMAELTAHDLKPFVALINNGLLTALMPAHVTYEAIDKENPAGFSKIWLQDILRTQLGFTGLVLSDCLSMKGADIGNLTTRAEKALSAGCDMLIVCHQPRELLLELIQTLNVEQKAESLARIVAFKKQMRRFANGKTQAYSSPAVNEQQRPKGASAVASAHDALNTTISI